MMQIALLSVSFAICFWATFKGMVDVWLTKDDYSHAFLIPPIALYLIWQRRNSLKNAEIKSCWLGLIPVVFLLLVVITGIMGSSPKITRPSIPLLLLVLTLFCYGPEVTKIMLFPILFLFFMIPFPPLIHSRLTWSLKLLSSKIALVLLHLSGLPAYGEGNIIDIGYTQLEVVDACSGLRYVYPLIAMGVIYSYFFQRKMWKRIVLVVSTIPLAVLMNSLRIAVTGILTEKWSPQTAEGFFHAFSGWLIFIVALAGLFIMNFFLNMLVPEETVQDDKTGEEKVGTEKRKGGDILKNNGPVLLSGAMLFGVFLLSLSVGGIPPVTLAKGIDEFPLVINEWHGRKNLVDPEIIERSGAEEAFEANYVKGGIEFVNLYIGYRGSAFLESENFFHIPDICLPSAGWTTFHKSTRPIDMHPYFIKFRVKELVTEKLHGKNLVYYWFQTNKRVAHNVDLNRLHLAIHAILRDNTPDVFVRVITSVGRKEALSSAQERLDRFVREMEPVLTKFLQKVEGES